MAVIRKKRSLFDGFFNLDIDSEFQKISEEMERMMREAQKQQGGRVSSSRPLVYGFSMRSGPDGKPVVEEFGNVPARIKGKSKDFEEREPLIDLIEDSKQVTVIVELPGVEKEDIKLNASEDKLEVRVSNARHKYSKEVDLHVKVKPNSAKATYKNGLLEVKLDRVKPVKEEGRPIKVE